MRPIWSYAPLADAKGGLLVIDGLEVVIPPPGGMTEEELRRWQDEALFRRGFTWRLESTPADGPLVEAWWTIEDEIPLGAVQTELRWHQVPGGGRVLGVRLTSGWTGLGGAGSSSS